MSVCVFFVSSHGSVKTQESTTFLLTAGPYSALRFSEVILTCFRNINKTEWALPGTVKP